MLWFCHHYRLIERKSLLIYIFLLVIRYGYICFVSSRTASCHNHHVCWFYTQHYTCQPDNHSQGEGTTLSFSLSFSLSLSLLHSSITYIIMFRCFFANSLRFFTLMSKYIITDISHNCTSLDHSLIEVLICRLPLFASSRFLSYFYYIILI
jgi:hypothetical protein